MSCCFLLTRNFIFGEKRQLVDPAFCFHSPMPGCDTPFGKQCHRVTFVSNTANMITHLLIGFFSPCRGRYDLKLFPGFLQLHGKTFDYKIPYQTILRLFLLPHKDGRQMYFVVSARVCRWQLRQSSGTNRDIKIRI